MTISCAWDYLLEQALSTSRMTHLSRVRLNLWKSVARKALVGQQRPEHGQWENRGFAGHGQEILSVPKDRSWRTWGWMENKHQVPGGCSWIDGLASANTFRSQLPRLSNVEQTWLGSCLTLVDPGKQREDWRRAWCIRTCFMQLRSGVGSCKSMLSRGDCSQRKEVLRWE